MSFSFAVRTPDGVAAAGDCDFLVIPTAQGEMGVLAGHAPVVSRVVTGDVRLSADGRGTRIRVGPGLVEVLRGVVTLFVVDARPGGSPGRAGEGA